jgi:hypothetical protein
VVTHDARRPPRISAADRLINFDTMRCGLSAPPMTFEAGGKQYVAILTGLSRVSKTRHVFTPELRDMRQQTMLFVFGL